ncbi:HAD family hydrolase [Aquabacterium sp. J223]|uniref:D-glycero-alpha-D-manno-heptose-1,7-bisphosphate 7-phosphatase n=1 Tax=Aquabacterium sp. J223 TaxID=2898431 RepID=UPI00289F7F32|nr:HAD family hydrolase [Aquabacterium sp. J223]
MRPAVFLDKDGTLVEDVPYNVDPALLVFTRDAVEGLRRLQAAGFALLVVTNQPGIALGLFDHEALDRLREGLVGRLAEHGVRLYGFHACPHAPGADGRSLTCACRKPAPGLLLQAARIHRLDLRRSWMVGDILHDVEAGRRAGCRTVLLDVGHETEWLPGPLRTPHHRCSTLLEAAEAILGAEAPAAAGPTDAPPALAALPL